jgi:hypothetical protein
MLAVTAVAQPQTAQVDNMVGVVLDSLNPASMAMFGEAVADHLERRVVQRFADEGDAASGNWPELRPTTKRIRANLGYRADGPINVRTEELFRWAAYSARIDNVWGGVVVTKPDVSAMDDVTLAKLETAQKGRSDNPLFPGASTPARKVVALDGADLTQIMALLQVHIMGQVISRVGASLQGFTF